MSLLRGLVDRKILRILTSLSSDELFHIQKLSSSSKVPLGTTFRIVHKLAKLGYVDVVKIGKFKIYRIKNDIKKELASELGDRK